MRGVPGPETAHAKALRWSELGILEEMPCPGLAGVGGGLTTGASRAGRECGLPVP